MREERAFGVVDVVGDDHGGRVNALVVASNARAARRTEAVGTRMGAAMDDDSDGRRREIR